MQTITSGVMTNMAGNKANLQGLHVALWTHFEITSDTKCIRCLLDATKHNKHPKTGRREDIAQRGKP